MKKTWKNHGLSWKTVDLVIKLTDFVVKNWDLAIKPEGYLAIEREGPCCGLVDFTGRRQDEMLVRIGGAIPQQ